MSKLLPFQLQTSRLTYWCDFSQMTMFSFKIKTNSFIRYQIILNQKAEKQNSEPPKILISDLVQIPFDIPGGKNEVKSLDLTAGLHNIPMQCDLESNS